MSQRRVLFVLTGHNQLGDTGDATGFHLTEAAVPWAMLTAAGIYVDLVTPDGGPAPIDPSSKDLSDARNQRFLNDADVQQCLKNCRALSSVKLTDYVGLYFPGGHGTMWDLPEHSAVISAVRAMIEAKRPVAAVCHGPAALVNVRLSDGSWLVAGRQVSMFTNKEEQATGKDDVMPFMLASTLRARGATLRQAENFEPCVSVDGHLITGQNPASAEGVADALLRAIDSLASPPTTTETGH